jgi:hypothetical protein
MLIDSGSLAVLVDEAFAASFGLRLHPLSELKLLEAAWRGKGKIATQWCKLKFSHSDFS